MNLKQIFGFVTFISVCWANETALDLKAENPYVFLGECVTFICSVSSMQYGNSTTLYMTFNETRFPDDQYKIVDEQTMKFNKCMTDLNQAGMYYCKQDTITIGRKTDFLFYGDYIFIEKPLVRIPKDSIHCFVTDWLSMNCTWSLGETYVRENDINVSLTSIIATNVQNCAHLLQTSCKWKKNDITFNTPFMFNLTVFHQERLDKKLVTTYHVPRDKPVKVSKVKYYPNSIWTNSSCFSLKWKHRFFYKLLFRVTYSSKFEKKKTVRTNKTKINICGCLPGEKYKVQIFASSKLGVTWSDPLILNVVTNLTYPSHPLSLTNNSFMWSPHKTAIIPYWKCLTRRQSGAEKVWYVVEVENQTMLAIPGQTAIQLPPHKEDQSCWFIQIWAENSYGRSRISSSMTICNNTSVPPASEDVEMLIINNTHVKVMWSKAPFEKTSVSSIKILAYKNCSIDFQWFAANRNENSVVLQVSDNDSYSFGVVAQNSNGSSGITWGSCYYLIKRPLKAVDKFSVEPFNDKLQIYWQPYNCKDENAYITGYKIKYCIALNSSKCHESEKVKNVSKTLRKFQTSQLAANDYLVWMEPISYAGLGPSSVKHMVQISDSSLGVGAIIGVVISGTIAFLFLILGCKYFKMNISSQMDKCNPPCDVPTIPDTSECPSNTHSYSGEKDSPISSLNTEILQLSTNSLVNTAYVSSDELHPYIRVSLNSLDSQTSIKPGSKKPSVKSTTVQNANNNAFTLDIGNSDCAPFDQLSRDSDQNKSSFDSLDKLLGLNDRQEEPELNYTFLDYNGQLKNFAADDVESRKSTDSGNIEENYVFPDYVKNVPSSENISGGKSVETLNPSETLSEENVLPFESNKDSLKSQVNESLFSEYYDTSTKKEITSNSSGKESGNDSMSDEMGYVKVDDIQTDEKVFKMDDFSVQKAEFKQIDAGGTIDEGYVFEVPV